MNKIIAALLITLGFSPLAGAQDASSVAVCQTRVQSLQQYLNQDTATVTPDCKKEIDDSLSASSTTNCFNDPDQAIPKPVGASTGANAAARAQAAALKVTDQNNQTQMNYCYLHLNRIDASCTADEAKVAVKALNDYAACSGARSSAAQAMAAQSGQVADATKSGNVQTASMASVAMGCYLGVCAASGLMGAASSTLSPSSPIMPSIEDMETSGMSQPKPRGPNSAQSSIP